MGDNIEISPKWADHSNVPEIPFYEFIMNKLNEHLPALADKPWIVDVLTGRTLKFGEIEEKSRIAASALARLGLRRGDILYYVCFEMTQVYIAIVAAWRLGVATRGCFQGELPDEFARQMKEGDVKIALIDAETAPSMREAASKVGWPVKLISLGPQSVEGIISFDELLKDDGSAFPNKVEVNVHEDIVVIPNTSGSTGFPKGAMHSHYSCVSMFHGLKQFAEPHPQMTLANNFAVANFFAMINCLFGGATLHVVAKYRSDEFFGHLVKYKPSCVTMYPFVASWFARAPEMSKYDMSFLNSILIGGSCLDHTTYDILSTKLPNCKLLQAYAMSEAIGLTITVYMTSVRRKTCEYEGETYVSSGRLFPYAKAKIVDLETGKETLGRMKSGEVLIKTPHMMNGYLRQDKGPDRSSIDENGWLHTGDIGLFDDEGFLYIRERKSFMFKYYMFYVSPCDVEAALAAHPAVQEVGVVGVTNLETTSLARAYVVLRSGVSVTAAELEAHAAKKLPFYMHLYGGVRFVDKLPANRGGKLDRLKLREIAENDK